ncbi:MAG: hypothetical protein HY690_08210 [Chloroflexi bacterium]|nr:hypothetical protein [Chloroflexota bacterium]
MTKRRWRGEAGGYTFLGPKQLERALSERRVGDAEIGRVLALFLQPDPAGVIPTPTREEVAHVVAYLCERVGRVWVSLSVWRLIEQGHPAARAIWWHEFQELESYRLLHVRNPLSVPRPSPRYVQAHARASWEEARYWEAWAAAGGEEISARAFIHAHPLRTPRELREIINQLRDVWKIEVGQPTVVELRRAQQFYHAKQLTSEVLEW